MATAIFFEERQKKFQTASKRSAKISNQYSTLRVVVFLFGLILTVYFANTREASLMYTTIIVAIILLSIIIRRHNQIKHKRDHYHYLASINLQEIERLHGNIQSFSKGTVFVNEDHPYSTDLDIFGRNSVFQLINRTVTQPGTILLAEWLQTQADPSIIQQRQTAVAELSKQVEWRQQFQASAMHFKDERSDISALLEWMKEPDKFANMAYQITSIIFPVITIAAIIGVFILGWSFYWFLAMLFLSGGVLSRSIKKVSETSDQITKSLNTIRGIYALIMQIRKAPVESSYLEENRNKLFNPNYNILREIKMLQHLLQFFEARSNGIYAILNVILMGDYHLMHAAERWRKVNKSNLHEWFDVVAEFEAINSLAGTLYTHENFTMPQIKNGYKMKFTSIGHPLINPEERVCNDFEMDGKGKVVIVTGSNMSGKSTFLRTLGINMVLAHMGGPVCAKSAMLPYTTVFSGMRIKDNLEEHISSFYAELKRIKQLLDSLQDNSVPVFYLLDEILKGTNSKDRHLGSEALIHQLSLTNSLGVVSTHDLSLGNLSEDSDQILNQSFSSSIEGNEILFDYKVNAGVCDSFNASKLMEKMGIYKRTTDTPDTL